MGHYTELHAIIKLRKDTPKEVIDLLRRVVKDGDIGIGEKRIFNHTDVPKPDIDHPFFDCTRWYMLLLSNNFDPNKGSSFIETTSGVTIKLNTEFKNYDNEIEHFFSWIKPYVRGRKKKTYLGWWKPESANWQTHEHLVR